MKKYPRLMLAAASSGSGKTVITCGLLKAFLNRGIAVKAFKCGPDYIDPMFHRYVLGVEGGNLDSFFLDPGGLRTLYGRIADKAELSVIEGVMGYYDGMGGNSLWASSYEVACALDVPVVLILDGRGASLTLAAVLNGLLSYREDSHVAGVILNRVSPSLTERLRPALEALGVKVYGCLPVCRHAELDSRHLGLLAPEERDGLADQLAALAEEMESYIDIDGLADLARSAPPLGGGPACEEPGGMDQARRELVCGKAGGAELVCRERKRKESGRVRIAVARDEAFSFYYQENLAFLEELGASLVPFSPMKDEMIPEGCHGLLLGGGYPELHGAALSSNSSMLRSVRESIQDGMPVLAECGGFLYLHEQLEGQDGKHYPMAGVIPAKAFAAGRLSHFGYVELCAKADAGCLRAGEKLKGHEFHYWESTAGGDAMEAGKPAGGGRWDCMYARGGLLAGFPHLYYPCASQAIYRWLNLCEDWKERRLSYEA